MTDKIEEALCGFEGGEKLVAEYAKIRASFAETMAERDALTAARDEAVKAVMEKEAVLKELRQMNGKLIASKSVGEATGEDVADPCEFNPYPKDVL